MKKFLENKLIKEILGGILTVLILTVLLFLIYVYNPGFIPKAIGSAVKNVSDKIIGKELAEKIDETRDENGATAIRLLFNMNKEENLEKHCEKKEENGQVQEKCFKTYVNEEFGYSVEYPEEWQYVQSTNLSGDLLDGIQFWSEETFSQRSEGIPSQIAIYVYQDSGNLSANDWVSENTTKELVKSISNITVKNINWIKVEEGGDPDHYLFVTKKDQKMIVISIPIGGFGEIDEFIENFKIF